MFVRLVERKADSNLKKICSVHGFGTILD